MTSQNPVSGEQAGAECISVFCGLGDNEVSTA